MMSDKSQLRDSVNEQSTVEDTSTANEAHDLNSVFQKLEVDCQCNLEDLPATHDQMEYPYNRDPVGHCYHGKMNSRSPAKDKASDRPMKGGSRSKPYAVMDLPFGDALDQLTLKSEQCLNLRCQCNSQPDGGPHCNPDTLNFVHACQSKQRYTKKIIQDAKLKLHHRQKDHNGVLRAARLKLHKLNGEWYKSAAPRKGTVQRKSIFGEASNSDIEGFNSLCRETTRNIQHSGQLFSGYRTVESRVGRQKMSDTSQEDSISTCTCSVQARLQTDYNVEELASYLDDFLYLPKEMSPMAEMMYT